MTFIAVLFILLLAYQVKHFLADYILQGEYMLGKFKGGSAWIKPLLAHVGVHAAMTWMIAIIVFCRSDMPVGQSVVQAFAIAFLDAFIHFFMDRLKASPKLMGRWKPLTAADYINAKSIVTDAEVEGWHRMLPTVVSDERKKLRGNKLFWWALGFDQMVHHVTHYGCVYLILNAAGLL